MVFFIIFVEINNVMETEKEIIDNAALKWVFETNGHKWSNNDNTAGDNYGSFIAGAKYMAERMYSEEEVIKLLISCKNRFGGSELYDYTHDDEVKKWFEYYKKK